MEQIRITILNLFQQTKNSMKRENKKQNKTKNMYSTKTKFKIAFLA